ncbi:cytidylate kinase family protein [Candidatus Micrarchaeota archaeon]|nr:cytidylate kinase family protein [Candidatus Micrarchaeota archaeon]
MKIAISGLSGSGISTACEGVGKKLNLKIINFTFRNMATEIGADLETLQEKRKNDDSFDYLLDKRQLELFGAEKNAILGSRLAIWLADANMRVWVHAPLEIRAKRIAGRENISFEKALIATKQRDKENKAQYKKLYGIDVSKHEFADLVLDSGKLNAAQIANKIANEAKKDKYKNVKMSKYGARIGRIISDGLKTKKC